MKKIYPIKLKKYWNISVISDGMNILEKNADIAREKNIVGHEGDICAQIVRFPGTVTKKRNTKLEKNLTLRRSIEIIQNKNLNKITKYTIRRMLGYRGN